jgi:hypothetical protein
MLNHSMRNYIYAIFLPVTIFLFISAFAASAQSASGQQDAIEELLRSVPSLTPRERAALLDGLGTASGDGSTPHAVTRAFGKGDPPVLVPRTSLSRAAESGYERLSPGLGVETLLLTRAPNRGMTAEVALRSMYRILKSVSTMEGITYYSVSRGKRRVLFERSFRVAGPDEREPLADVRTARIPETETVYVLQDDSTFGENLYRVEYRAEPDALMLTMVNLTAMRYGILPAVGAEKLRITIMIVPRGEYLLFYGSSGAVASDLPFFASRVRESFENRIRAIYDWFTARLDASSGG